MMMELEDVVSHLQETLENMKVVALSPNESVQKQYVNLGIVEGIKIAIMKINNMNGRDDY